MQTEKPQRCEETVPFPSEFDNPDDIARDMGDCEKRALHKAWDEMDADISGADPERMRVALMYVNSRLDGRDRALVCRILRAETQQDVENRKMDAGLLKDHPVEEGGEK